MADSLVCFVGCGAICASHVKRLRGRVRAVFHSRSPDSAEAMNSQAGGEGTYDTYDSVIRDPAVEAVVITSPPDVHAEQVIAALEAGKTVLVEKPMCLERAELQAIDTAPTARLMVAENYVFKPSLAKLRAWIDAGEVGRVTGIRLRKCTMQEGSGWRACYGALIEGGIHFVALLTALADAEVVDVRARFPGYRADDPERHAVLKVEFENGIIGEVDYGWDTPSLTKGTFQHSEIVGDAGRIVFESNGIYASLSGRGRAFSVPGLGDLLGYGAMMDEFLAFLDGGPTRSGYDKARRDLDVVFRAYEQLPGPE